MKTQPRIGWVRATAVSDAETLREINELRKRNDQLAAEMAAIKLREAPQAAVPNLASLDAPMRVFGTYHGSTVRDQWELTTTWRQLFALLAPYLLSHPNDSIVKSRLSESLFAVTKLRPAVSQIKPTLDDQIFQTIKIQLVAHGLVDVEYLKTTEGGMALFWQLTKAGQAALLELRTVKGE